MSKKSPEQKLMQKRDDWVSRTALALGIDQDEAKELLHTERNQSLRINPLKGDPGVVVEEIHKLGWVGEQFAWMPEGYSIETGREALRDSDLVANGQVYIQNSASWLAAVVLDPQPNEAILDLCAAPGGKTSHLAAMTGNKAHIIANDNSYGRLQRLKANCKRLGAEIDEFTLFDAGSISKKMEGKEFDKILIDAPCSGEGMMRYDVDKDFLSWSVAHIRRLQGLQKQMIKQAWRLLKPGGFLVYSTCTMAPEENEAVISYVLRSLESVEIVPIDIKLENRVPTVKEWNGKAFNPDTEACLRLKPSKDMHAFFIAKLQKGLAQED